MAQINLPKRKENRIVTTRVREYQKVYQHPKWSTLRDRKFRDNPICEECDRNGMTTPTEEIHHIIRFADGVTDQQIKVLAYSYDNLMALCISCHKLKHKHYRIDRYLFQKLLKNT